MAFTKVILTGTKDKIKAAFERFNTLIDDLLATTSGKGASQIGIQDVAGNMDAANVEDALAEIYTDTASVRVLGEIFAVNISTTTGLTWGYTAGTVRFDNTVTAVAAGTVSLTDNATNYVEIDSAGSVSRNTVGFTSGRLPIRQIVTLAGVQTTSTDKRSWFQAWDMPLPVAKGGTGAATLTDGGILLGSGTGAITALGVATNGQIPIGDGTTDPVLAAPTGTANQITVTLGAGTIALSLPSALIPPGTVDPVGVLTVINTGLHILDTNASHDLIIKPGSDLTADKTLTVTTGDADRTISLAGNLTLAGDLTTAGAISVSAYGATIIDDADAATARATLGGVPLNTINMIAGTGLSGGGTLAADRTFVHAAHTGDVTGATVLTIAAGAVTAGTIGAAAVTQSKLATSQGSVNRTGTSSDAGLSDLTLPGGEYGFYPQIKGNEGGLTAYICDDSSVSTVYITNICLYPTLGVVGYAQQRYVTASGEIFWLFILRDKVTKQILAMYQSPDHPCFGNGGKPNLVQHPFNSVRENRWLGDKEVEIMVVNPDHNLVQEAMFKKIAIEGGYPDKTMYTNCKDLQIGNKWHGLLRISQAKQKFKIKSDEDAKKFLLDYQGFVLDENRPNRDLLEVLSTDYELDNQVLWSKKICTVGLPDEDLHGTPVIDWRMMPIGTPIEPIKVGIPLPQDVLSYSIKEKNNLKLI